MMKSMIYVPALESRGGLDILKKTGGEPVLFGDGPLNPAAFFTEISALAPGGKYIEITGRDRNRDRITADLRTASEAGFSGAVLAAGPFFRDGVMPMPVYDLDPTQMLVLAAGIRKGGLLRGDFLLGVRSAGGDGFVLARARALVERGADFLLLEKGALLPGLENKTVMLEVL